MLYTHPIHLLSRSLTNLPSSRFSAHHNIIRNLSGLLPVPTFFYRTKVPQHQPGRPNCHRPERKVPINSTDLRKDGDAADPVTDRLPSTLRTSQQRRIPDNLIFSTRQLGYVEVEEQVVQLKTSGQKNEDGKGVSETVGRPIVSWCSRSGVEPRHVSSGPRPERTLEDDNSEEGSAGAGAQWDCCSVEVESEQIAECDGDDSGDE